MKLRGRREPFFVSQTVCAILVLVPSICVADAISDRAHLSADVAMGAILATLLGVGGLWLWFIRHRWARFSRWITLKPRPVIELIEGFPLATRYETEYRDALLERIRTELHATEGVTEAELGSKSRVDAYFQFAGDEWFVSIKKGLDPQQRKLLQGEAEEMIERMMGGEDGYAWILLVVALPRAEERSHNQREQLRHLERHAARRSRTIPATQGLAPRVRIKVVVVQDARPDDVVSGTERRERQRQGRRANQLALAAAARTG